jgi:osmotically-inducible protein OsmY
MSRDKRVQPGHDRAARRRAPGHDAGRLVPASVDAKAGSGVVTLTGTAAWQYQREEAEFVAGNVPGVVDLDNQITLTSPQPKAGDVKQSIERAFQRNAKLDAEGLSVTTHGNRVLLRGAVSSWDERDAAVARRGRPPASLPSRTRSSWSTERRRACGRSPR